MNNIGETINKNSKPLLLILGLVVVLMIIFVFFRFSQNTNQIDQNQEINEQIIDDPQFGTIIENSNVNSISAESGAISIPEGWLITSAHQNTQNSKFKCDNIGQSDCRIYTLSNGIYNFYLSIPAPVRYFDGPVVEEIQTTKNFAGSETMFIYDKVQLQERTDVEEGGEASEVESNLFIQIYGCNLNNRICLSSLALDLTSNEINSAQVQAFEQLVNSISVN